MLITSRTAAWRGVAVPVEVGVLDRLESAGILRGWVDGLSDADVGLVAEAVGDLPVALAQAAGFMAQTGTPAAEYAGLLAERAAEILDLIRGHLSASQASAARDLAVAVVVASHPGPSHKPGNWHRLHGDDAPNTLVCRRQRWTGSA